MRQRLREGPVWMWEGRLSPPWGFPSRPSRRNVGQWGEWVALRHLRRLEWDVLARNWTSPRGELDLVAYHERELVFIEVRTRMAPSFQRPEESVGTIKERKLERLGWDFVLRFGLVDEPYRLDLIAVDTPDLRSFELRHYCL